MAKHLVGFSHGKNVKLLLVIGAALLVCLLSGRVSHTQASFASYYVAPNGNNNNPGTLAAPWRTISYAASNSAIRPGDTVYIRGGTYNEYVLQKISGTQSSPITYRNYPGETPVLTGEGTWRWHILERSHIRIEGLTFRNFGEGAIQIRTRNGNITNIAIVNNRFENQYPLNGNGAKTIHVTTAGTTRDLSHVLIEGNTLYNVDTGNHPAIQVAGTAHHVSILNNIIAETSNIAIGVAGRSDIGQPDNILIKGNNIYGHGSPVKNSPGVYLDGAGQNIIIEKNIIHDGIRGIIVSAEDVARMLRTDYVIVRWNVLYNNSEMNLKLGVGNAAANCANSADLEYSVAVHNTVFADTGSPTNNFFGCGEHLRWKNNILGHVSPPSAFHYRFENNSINPATWKLDYNYFYSGAGNKLYHWAGSQYATLASYQAAASQDQHSLTGNPQFVNVNQRDFRLRSNSPARDAGGPLTQTTSAGSGTVIPVAEPWYFSDGLGLQTGDRVRIGTQAPATVVSVNYANRTITVNRTMTWQNGESVQYDYAGSRPDMGAFEFAYTANLQGIPGDGQISLTWELDDDLPPTAAWQLAYEGPAGNQPSPIVGLPVGTQSYQLTGLTNFTSYTITLTAVDAGETLLTEMVSIMPTDKFIYLPLLQQP